MDQSDPFREHRHLRSANLAVERRQLPVHIRNADVVQIDQGEPADPAPGEPFRGPGADPTHPDYGDAGGRQTGEGRGAKEAAEAAETGEEIRRGQVTPGALT